MAQPGEPGYGMPETVYGQPSVMAALAGRPEPEGIDMGTRLGMPVVGCGHPAEEKWLTRGMVHCACGTELSRWVFWEVALAVEVVRPKVHCRRWRLGDPEDKHHALRCTARGWSEAAWAELEGSA